MDCFLNPLCRSSTMPTATPRLYTAVKLTPLAISRSARWILCSQHCWEMSKTCMRSRQRCRRSKTMRANLPPRLSPSVEPPSNGMELQQRQRYVPYTHERNYACRITECTFRGLRSVILENQIIRISVAADKGADIYEFLHKPTDTEFLLRTPL